MPVISTGLPAASSLFRSSSSPMMKSSRIRPISDTVWMLAWSLMRPEPDLRTDEHAREQVREQQRLPSPVADERERRRNRNAYADTGQKIDMLSHQTLHLACPSTARKGPPSRA